MVPWFELVETLIGNLTLEKCYCLSLLLMAGGTHLTWFNEGVLTTCRHNSGSYVSQVLNQLITRSFIAR